MTLLVGKCPARIRSGLLWHLSIRSTLHSYGSVHLSRTKAKLRSPLITPQALDNLICW